MDGPSSSYSCVLPPAPPLVSLVILTCNRPAFLRLALRSAVAQTYRPLEAIVVDDGDRAVTLQPSIGDIPIRLVRSSSKRSIGEKRNAGVSAARGAILMHWDDDDMHAPNHVSTLACPILRNASDFTCLTFSYLARISTTDVSFYDYRRGRAGRAATGPFLGSLAYARSVATGLSNDASIRSIRSSRGSHAHSGRQARLSPFAPYSLSEDLHFVERAIGACHRMLPISNVAPIVYTRHAASSVRNTWRPTDFASRLDGSTTQPPPYVDHALVQQYVRAEAEAARLGSCIAIARREPPGISRPLRFPYNPPRCCIGRPRAFNRRPCTDEVEIGAGCGAEPETFCGATKGLCTSTCTCTGELAHGTQGRPACGVNCCQYWHRFWRRHPENCTMPRLRPLKRHYCSSKGKKKKASPPPAAADL